MRVTAGEARGVPLAVPPGRGTRPTTDRLKEAIFAVLGDLGCEGRVLDLFAGSGALGIEALSRGADSADFVESAGPACRTIGANLARTKLSEAGTVHHSTVERFVAGAATGEPYQLILLDPPYDYEGLDALLRRLAESPLAGPETAVLVEHARGRGVPPRIGRLALDRTRAHGDSAFSLYRAALAPGGPPPGSARGSG